MQTPIERVPNETQIIDCMTQLVSKNTTSYSEVVQKYARLRLADFSELLKEWQNPEFAAQLGQAALPNVANAIHRSNLTPEQSQKLLAYLMQTAKQGNTTAVLYLAYLHAKGLHAPQSLQKTASYVRYAAQKGDWRATRFWAELLIASPLAARELLETDVQAAAEKWHEQQGNIAPDKIEQSCRRYYAAPAMVKFAARQRLEMAQKQGSPTAEKRLKGLTVLGELPANPPAKQFQSVENWLELQFSKNQTAQLMGGGDVTFLPENVPLLPQPEDEEPVWYKPAKYGAMFLIGLLFFTLMMKMTVPK
ncbi:hypothetical protein QDY68_04215 [Kingella negevensis]|uniref:hypothetical protein n=1 Tax=Kingella negevensis TaxID=1522312 RepID=UPI00255056DC|nr:hypothetical protein [Kingella negevensis]MDK4708047.1 hypothetical protein [Kingella negevensis]MDK4709611.1 hypothetical protein [Kingella negevensis]